MADLLIRRFEHYFRHPDSGHDVLRPGDQAVACRNVRTVLEWFGVGSGASSSGDVYDDELSAAVRAFQTDRQHRIADGLVGPGTRELLTSEVLHRFQPSIFQRLIRPERRRLPSAFLSYARADQPKVDKLNQWLQDHGVQVIRDMEFFVAGTTIQENIADALSAADKIIAVYSANSKDRDWPRLERSLAEQVETRLGSAVLIYLRLDDTPLPAYDPHRLAVEAEGRTLKEIGAQLLHAVAGTALSSPRYEYDEDKPL
ncbi:TIR domain-containing protein [Dactylosporangium sp. NPDC049525]|uniref:toll/interleukin-1 receptor domain-containing protein n=1 Tax=Dactylosporangium sp. NPDC049525 TaxID=3154730 RepID=UPI00344A92A3